ncbi:MAG: DNA recombination protein RmuC [Actinomycetota bacterium]
METAILVLAAALVAAAFIVSRRGRGLDPHLAELTSGLAREEEVSRSVQARLEQAVGSLGSLAAAFEERRHLEEQATRAVERVDRLIAGSYGRGLAGENLLAAALAEFPPELLIRDFSVAGRTCEFALRLPDGKLLPVDSKWTAFDLVTELQEAGDPARREELRRRVERAVCARIPEVGGYIDPALTGPVAVIALPDAVYACCRRAHVAAHQARVLLVSYALAVPFLLGVWSLYRAYARDADVDRVVLRVHDVSVCLEQLRDRLDGKLSRALTTAGNAASEIRAFVAAAEASIAALGHFSGIRDEPGLGPLVGAPNGSVDDGGPGA